MPLYSKFTSLYTLICFIILFNWECFSPILGQYLTSRNGPPRFKQNARSHQYAYLGDNVKFKCTAVGRPQPKVHWYRNGGYLNYSFMQAHPRFREKSMSLEIQRIEVGDKGNWMCRVWNNEGSTTRNFTLHIINYCDYFLNLNIESNRIPEECLCEWAIKPMLAKLPEFSDDDTNNQEHNSFNGHFSNSKYYGDDNNDSSLKDEGGPNNDPSTVMPTIRTDVDLSDYNVIRCAKYFHKDSQLFTNKLPLSHSTGPIGVISHALSSNVHIPLMETTSTMKPSISSLKQPPSSSSHPLKPIEISTIKAATSIISKRKHFGRKPIKSSTIATEVTTEKTTRQLLKEAKSSTQPNRMRFIIEGERLPFPFTNNLVHDEYGVDDNERLFYSTTEPINSNNPTTIGNSTHNLSAHSNSNYINVSKSNNPKINNNNIIPDTNMVFSTSSTYAPFANWHSSSDSNNNHNGINTSTTSKKSIMPINARISKDESQINSIEGNDVIFDNKAIMQENEFALKNLNNSFAMNSNQINNKPNLLTATLTNQPKDIEQQQQKQLIISTTIPIITTTVGPSIITTSRNITNPIEMFDHLMETGLPDITHLLPGLMTSNAMQYLKMELIKHWQLNLEIDAKMKLANEIIANVTKIDHTVMKDEDDNNDDEDDDDEDDDYESDYEHQNIGINETVDYNHSENHPHPHRHHHNPHNTHNSNEILHEINNGSSISTTNSLQATDTTTTTRVPWYITRRWPQPPSKVPPYFRQFEGQVNHVIVLPAGRTLKLNCKAGGQPEPQVVWRKDNVEIQRSTESRTGSLFHIRKWSLELEDASESDSGDYECEVFNSIGWITRHFRVDVQDRLRSRPILVPNVLLNQTIDVNNTVNFTCQVISDLVPHIIWIKLVKKDGSFIRYDPKKKQQSFNFIDMSTVKKARIFHNNMTNRYTLEIRNVTMEDQGIYSCVAGNTLGMSMGNATLTVNEFRPMTLPTENPYSWPISYTILLALCILLLLAFVILGILYYFFSKKFTKNRIQNLDKMAVRKKIIITKKPKKDGDIWSDLASSYAITVEPVMSSVGDHRQTGHASSDVTLLSEYEVPTDLAWEIDRNRLQLVDILGEGAFGEVWRGTLSFHSVAQDNTISEQKIPVAVKKLKATANEKELIILVSEMQILKSIGEHKNILRLVGCCTGLGPLLVVLEVCPHGNLRDFLRKHRPNEENADNCASDISDTNENMVDDDEKIIDFDGNCRHNSDSKRGLMYQNVENLNDTIIKNLTLKDLVRFATEIARGMEFLASRKIIHRDLAARNVLVAENYVMKISDFGLSRNVFYHDYYHKRGAGRLPIKWMAPEALEANVYTVYSDVWSYGILLWEIMTLGGTPYPSIAMPQLYNILKEGYRMEAPHNCPDEIYGVMVMCWQEKPEQRPQFHTIANYFDWMLAEAANYVSKSDDGETTDEGPYAVINESVNNSKSTARRMRPVSAPGIMSFEAFASRESQSSTQQYPHSDADILSKSCDNGMNQNGEMDDEKMPLLNDEVSRKFSTTIPPKKSSLIEQLQTDKIHNVQKQSNYNSIPTDNNHFYANTLKSVNEDTETTKLCTEKGNDKPEQQQILVEQQHSDSRFVDSAICSPLLLLNETSVEGRFPGNIAPIVYMPPKTGPKPVDNDVDNALEHIAHEYVNELYNLMSGSSPPIQNGASLNFVNTHITQSGSQNGSNTSQPSTATTTAASSTKSLNSSSSSSSSSSSTSHFPFPPPTPLTQNDTISNNTQSDCRQEVTRRNNIGCNLSDLAINRTDKSKICDGDTEAAKKSVVSEHALRVNAVTGETPAIFRTIGQQINRKNGSSLSDKSSQPSGSGSLSSSVFHQISSLRPHFSRNEMKLNDTSNGKENDPNNNNNNNTNTKIGKLKRSCSIDSQGSSGRGGSSAMSSVEGLGNVMVTVTKPIKTTPVIEYAIVHAPNKEITNASIMPTLISKLERNKRRRKE